MCTPSPVLPRAVLPSFSGHVDSLGHEDRALGGRDNSPGRSGRVYTIEKVLAERENPLLCVYRARYLRTAPVAIRPRGMLMCADTSLYPQVGLGEIYHQGHDTG